MIGKAEPLKRRGTEEAEGIESIAETRRRREEESQNLETRKITQQAESGLAIPDYAKATQTGEGSGIPASRVIGRAA